MIVVPSDSDVARIEARIPKDGLIRNANINKGVNLEIDEDFNDQV
jgi:hypothetical protein